MNDYRPETGLNDFAKEIHKNAVQHGWWDVKRTLPEILMLCVSELAEALEEYRNNNPVYYTGCRLNLDCTISDIQGATCPERSLDDGAAGIPCPHSTGKPQGIVVELADCIIRFLDYCGRECIDIETAIREKFEYNKTRPYKHGGKLC